MTEFWQAQSQLHPLWVPDYTDHVMSRRWSFTGILHIPWLLHSLFSFLWCLLSLRGADINVLWMATLHSLMLSTWTAMSLSIFNHSVKERLLWLSLRVELVCRHTHKYLGDSVTACLLSTAIVVNSFLGPMTSSTIGLWWCRIPGMNGLLQSRLWTQS